MSLDFRVVPEQVAKLGGAITETGRSIGRIGARADEELTVRAPGLATATLLTVLAGEWRRYAASTAEAIGSIGHQMIAAAEAHRDHEVTLARGGDLPVVAGRRPR
jgi:hypothetical protein